MRRGALAVLAALVLAGCTPTPPSPTPTPTATTSPSPVHHFTVGTTDKITTTDPAAAVQPADQAFAYNVFQRLMSVEPVTGKLVPDAAQDCLFASPTVYECHLRKDLRFHNGEALTSADVRFSILRALRLGVAGSSVTALRSLATVETRGDDVVRFNLRWSDTEFGFALTSPATSILPTLSYDSDREQDPDQPIVGSGPYVAEHEEGPSRTFVRFDKYQGPTLGQLDTVVLRRYKDSAALEDAMGKGEVDVVWRGLSDAAEKRLADQASANSDHRTDAGFVAAVAPHAVLRTVRWDPRSGHRLDGNLRQAVAAALQEDRTLDSLIPPGGPGHTAAFPLGGSPSPSPTAPKDRVTLTMAFNPNLASEADFARRVRERLESSLPVSVRLVPEPATADLHVGPSGSWVGQPLGYLLDYLAQPLPGSLTKLLDLEQRYRAVSEKDQRDVALVEIQKQAAADLTVVPIEAVDQTVYLGRGVQLSQPVMGPGWQLLFSVMHR